MEAAASGTRAERILATVDTWAREMVSPWCPAQHIAYTLKLNDREVAEAVCDLIEAGKLEWGLRPIWGGQRDVRRTRPRRLDDLEWWLMDRIETYQKHRTYSVGISDLLHPDLTEQELRALLERMTAQGILVRAGNGWRVP